MQRCEHIKTWVEEKVGFFVKDGSYQRIVSQDCDIKPSYCYVVEMPSQWLVNKVPFYLMIRKNIKEGGIVMILDIGQDEYGIEMCTGADEYKKLLGMLGVVERRPYMGEEAFFLGKDLVLYQFWRQEITVGLDEWVDY